MSLRSPQKKFRKTRLSANKKILLFSTLNPYPFWAGSENYWYDFVRHAKVHDSFQFHVVLADSPVTRAKGKLLEPLGIRTSFYKHFNVDFVRRNLYKVTDKLRSSSKRTLPWYDEIERQRPDLVWFCVSTLDELADLSYAVEICRRWKIPYWLLVQHGYEDLFFTNPADLDATTEISLSARRFIFIAENNRRALERAICRELTNAFHSANTLPEDRLAEAAACAERSPAQITGTARFFNLGRFSPKHKGQHLLIEALAQTHWRDRDWILTFVGIDGFGRTYLERLAAFFGFPPDRLAFVPFVEQVFDEIVRHDVLLMPSLAEGTPYAMIESMACGRPTLGTPIGGIPELIDPGKNGWMARTVAVGDVEAAMETMWSDRDRWSVMGDSARSFVNSNYCSTRIMDELLDKLVSDTE